MIVTMEIGNDVGVRVDKDSKDRIIKIVFSPEFGSAGDIVTLATCTASSATGKELDACTIKVSGRNGRVSRKPRGGVMPLVDRDEQEQRDGARKPDESKLKVAGVPGPAPARKQGGS